MAQQQKDVLYEIADWAKQQKAKSFNRFAYEMAQMMAKKTHNTFICEQVSDDSFIPVEGTNLDKIIDDFCALAIQGKIERVWAARHLGGYTGGANR